MKKRGVADSLSNRAVEQLRSDMVIKRRDYVSVVVIEANEVIIIRIKLLLGRGSKFYSFEVETDLLTNEICKSTLFIDILIRLKDLQNGTKAL